MRTHYACRGGASGNNIFCGSCLCDLNDTDYHTRWHIGVALSLYTFLVMVPLVVNSLLMLIILLVMQTWALVLLYHLYAYTHYTLRGRDSYGRQFCGCWIVSFNSDYSYNVWLIGAALSFTLYTLYSSWWSF